MVKEKRVYEDVSLKGLKFITNFKKSKTKDFVRQATHLERRRLESYLILQGTEVLKGKVTSACFEVSEEDLSLMLEVVSLPSIQSRFNIQQQEEPTQFLISARLVNVF